MRGGGGGRRGKGGGGGGRLFMDSWNNQCGTYE